MAAKRITIAVDVDEKGETGELRIYLNPEGRAWLIKELQDLSERNDHFHMFTEEWGSDELRATPYDKDDQIVHGAKILFRTDDWDRQYYPHVMKAPE